MQKQQYSAKEFLPLYRKELENCKEKQVVIILVNAKTQPFRRKTRIGTFVIIYLPPYNPKLNLNKELWG
jgi:hypothetical protein